MMVFTVGTNMACLESQLTMIRIMSKLDEKDSFFIKSIEIKFQSYLGIRSCAYSIVVWILCK